MVLIAVAVAVVVTLKEEVLVAAVRRKCHRRDTQAGEARLEPVPSREPAAVAPCLTVSRVRTRTTSRSISTTGVSLTAAPTGRTVAVRWTCEKRGCQSR